MDLWDRTVMTELSDGQKTIDAALAELSNLKQDFGEATSVLSTTQWAIAAGLLVLAIIIGFWVGKDTDVIDESQDLNSINDQKEEVSKNELEQLSKQLQERDSELKEAKDQAELTLLQLHQVQEELEQLFLENKDVPKQ